MSDPDPLTSFLKLYLHTRNDNKMVGGLVFVLVAFFDNTFGKHLLFVTSLANTLFFVHVRVWEGEWMSPKIDVSEPMQLVWRKSPFYYCRAHCNGNCKPTESFLAWLARYL